MEGDATEALEPAKEGFDLVAAALALDVVRPRSTPVRLGRDDRLIAELNGQLPSSAVFVGAVHDRGGTSRNRAEPAQQLSAAGRVMPLTS